MEISILGVCINLKTLDALLMGESPRTQIQLIENLGNYGKFRISQLDNQDTSDEQATTIVLVYGADGGGISLDVISVDVKKTKLSVGYLQEIGS